LKLAEAQIHQKQFDGAKDTLKTLRATMWPSRFTDVDNQIRNLENQLPQTDKPNL
jgi:predicted negative regulator of RcsB-dependent stress response